MLQEGDGRETGGRGSAGSPVVAILLVTVLAVVALVVSLTSPRSAAPAVSTRGAEAEAAPLLGQDEAAGIVLIAGGMERMAGVMQVGSGDISWPAFRPRSPSNASRRSTKTVSEPPDSFTMAHSSVDLQECQMSRMDEFFAHYRATFTRFERDPLTELFTFPLQVVSANADGVTVMALSRDDWPAVLDGLFGAYRTLGVSDAEPVELESLEVTPQLWTARVHWELRRDDGTPVYEFTAIYTVAEVGGALRVAGIAHDELPRLAAALTPS